MEVGDVMFTAGGPRELCLSVPVVDDLVPEVCVEMFGVTITSDGERVFDPPDMVVVQIVDDDGMSVDINFLSLSLIYAQSEHKNQRDLF